MANIFLKIVNMSISASWIIIVVLMLRVVLKKAPKWIFVLLWGIVSIRLICPFSVESIMSLIPSSETISPEIMMERTPNIDSGIPIINNAVNPLIGNSFSPQLGASANPLQIWIPIWAFAWFVGTAVMLLYAVISYWGIKRKIRTAILYCDNIYQSEQVVSPFVLGVVKPKIYLPFDISEQDMQHVIAHENAHIHRRDHLWKPFGFVVLTIHWFNPFVWIGYILLCRDIELACDEKAVKDFDAEQKADYSQALLSCSVNRRAITACPLAFGEVGVKNRVKLVLNYKKPAFWIVVLAIIASIALAVCFLTNPRKELDSVGFHAFKPIELIYDDGMYSFVQTVDLAPTYILVDGMELLEKFDGEISESLGVFEETVLKKDNFDSRFRTSDECSWLTDDSLKSLKRNNKRIWQLYSDSKDETPRLYILLEQKDGTFYLGYGYYNCNSIHPSNTDDSHVRRLYKLSEDTDYDEEDLSVEFQKYDGKKVLKEPPSLIVVSNEQSIEALQGTSSWIYDGDDGVSEAIMSDSQHPLMLQKSLPSIDILPTYASFSDPLGAILQFNAKAITPICEVPPDEIQINCWEEKYWGKPDVNSENIRHNIVNGNLFFTLKDGNYIYEIVATWNSNDKFSGTVHYAFYTVKANVDSYPKIGVNSKIEKTYNKTATELIDKAYENEEFVITMTHHQLDDGLWVSGGYSYMYRLEITGRMHNAAKNTTYIVLTNRKDITFEQTWKASGFSSLSTDYFRPIEATIVGHKLFE